MQHRTVATPAFDTTRITDCTSFQAGVPVKIVSERLGHANIAFTIQTYQHVLPGMQEDAADTAERLATPVPADRDGTVERRRNTRKTSA